MHDAKAIQSPLNAHLHSSSGERCRLCLPELPAATRISQEKQLFYAGTVPHDISEAKARCATAAAAGGDEEAVVSVGMVNPPSGMNFSDQSP